MKSCKVVIVAFQKSSVQIPETYQPIGTEELHSLSSKDFDKYKKFGVERL
jgi:hypothetical protein